MNMEEQVGGWYFIVFLFKYFSLFMSITFKMPYYFTEGPFAFALQQLFIPIQWPEFF